MGRAVGPALDKRRGRTDPAAMTPSGTLQNNPVDVAIIGGGLAGLTQAIALASHDISVTVIDREDPVRALAAGFDGRVSAITLTSQRMLAAIGLTSAERRVGKRGGSTWWFRGVRDL